MVFRKITEKVITIEPDGRVILFFEGYCDNEFYEANKLPTEGVCEGSNVIVTDTGDWLFFNEKTKTYIPETNIQG